MSDEQKETPKPKRIAIDIPKDMVGTYANIAFISHTPGEMVLDFAQVMPRQKHGRVMSRIIMSPMHAKMFHMALAQNIANYERQFGQIQMPQQSLASQFFRFPRGENDKDSDNKGDSEE